MNNAKLAIERHVDFKRVPSIDVPAWIRISPTRKMGYLGDKRHGRPLPSGFGKQAGIFNCIDARVPGVPKGFAASARIKSLTLSRNLHHSPRLHNETPNFDNDNDNEKDKDTGIETEEESSTEILVQLDQEVLRDTNRKFEEILQELKLFNHHLPDSYTPDIIANVYRLFDKLYANGQYRQCYELLKKVEPNYNLFFKFPQYSNIVAVLDLFGDANDIFQFCEIFKFEKVPYFWRRVERLKSDPKLKQLIELNDVISFDEAKLIMDRLLLHNAPDGLKIFTFRIASVLYRRFDTRSRIKYYDYLINLDDAFKRYFSPSLITQLFDTYCLTNTDFDEKFRFIEKFVLLHYDANKVDEKAFQFRLISALSARIDSTLKFKIWFNYCYKGDEKLSYENENENQSVVYLRNNRIHFLPKDFEKKLNVSQHELSHILSILIYAHHRSKYAQTFFKLKTKLQLPVSRGDKLGYLKSLAISQEYNKAFDFLNKCLSEDPSFESDDSLNPILLVLAKNKSWKRLENIYTGRYENNEVISKDQYITLFIALSVRAGTNEILMKLWENYLRRGFKPNDQILASIIRSFINNKSYEEAIQWFSAYSHFETELTSRSYGLMMEALTGLHQTSEMFNVLEELSDRKIRLLKPVFPPIFKNLSLLGDYKSIEIILNTFFPKFNLNIDRSDTRWLMQSHYHANRFDIIVNSYLEMNDDEISAKDSNLALESAIKYSETKTFDKVWKKAYRIHNLRGDLNIRMYTSYMANWVRKYGSFGIGHKINEIKAKLHNDTLPMILFNQMIFSGLRTHRPWLTRSILRVSLSNKVQPSPKTYSMILQSNVSMPWVAKASIDETIQILEEYLLNRKEDKFGKIHDDINPMSFKLVIKAVIKYKNITEARRLFQMYIDTSRDNLLNNIHILNTELLLLGEEEKWIDFDECYSRFMSILYDMINKSKLTNEELIKKFDESGDFNRLDVSRDLYLRKNYDEVKISKFDDISVKIPNYIKKAHFDVWQYRLRQFEIAEKLDDIISIVEDLMKSGVVFSNKNLNETALFLSKRPEYLEMTVNFIDRFILPYHVKNKNFKWMKIRYAMDRIPGFKPDLYYKFNNGIYFEVMKNLSDSLNERLTPEQRDDIFSSISSSPGKYILKNLEQIMNEKRHIRSGYLGITKLRTRFYRDLRMRKKIDTRRSVKRMEMFKGTAGSEYREKRNSLKKQMHEITRHIQELTDTDDLHTKRIREASEDVQKLLLQKKSIQSELKLLRKERVKVVVSHLETKYKQYKKVTEPTDANIRASLLNTVTN